MLSSSIIFRRQHDGTEASAHRGVCPFPETNPIRSPGNGNGTGLAGIYFDLPPNFAGQSSLPVRGDSSSPFEVAMTGDGTRPRRLSAVLDALAAGDLALAVDRAGDLLPDRPETDPEGYAAAIAAAGRFVAIAEGRPADEAGDSLSKGLELVDLASAASRGGVQPRIFVALAGDALAILEAVGRRIGIESAGGPPGPVRVDFWIDGATAAAAADYLAALYRSGSRIEDERRALSLRCRLAFRVMADDPAQMIAAMNDSADCLRRLGRPDEAARQYEDIIRDYGRLVEPFNLADRRPDDEDRLALEALADSYLGLRRLDPSPAQTELDIKFQSIDDILNRTDPSS
jgi:hypothetical protein